MQNTTTDVAPQTSGGGEAESVDRRQALQKLAVGGAVIWGAPLILGSTPAQAAGSVCGDRTLSWRSQNQDPLGLPKTIVVNDVTVTISQSFSGGSASYSPAGDPDLDVLNGPYGGVGSNTDSFLQFYQSAVQGGGRLVTFAFAKTGFPTQPKTVKNISFWVTDIDYATNNYDDQVILTPAFTSSNPAGSNVQTVSGVLQNSNQGNVGVNNVQGSTRVTRAAAVSSFTLQFLCGTRASGGHHAIFISDIAFNSCT